MLFVFPFLQLFNLYSSFSVLFACCNNIVLDVRLAHVLSGHFQYFQCIQKCYLVTVFFMWPIYLWSKMYSTQWTLQTLRALLYVAQSSNYSGCCKLCQSFCSSHKFQCMLLRHDQTGKTTLSKTVGVNSFQASVIKYIADTSHCSPPSIMAAAFRMNFFCNYT